MFGNDLTQNIKNEINLVNKRFREKMERVDKVDNRIEELKKLTEKLEKNSTQCEEHINILKETRDELMFQRDALLESHEKLENIKNRYRFLLDNSPMGISVTTRECVKFVNKKLADICETNVGDLLGTKMANFVHPDDLSFLTDMHGRKLDGEDVERFFTFRIITKSGKTKTVKAVCVLSEKWIEGSAVITFLEEV